MYCLLVHLKTEKRTKCLTFRTWTMGWSGKITLELGCQMLTCFIRMRRRRLICFWILSMDWKPDFQPKIDKTEKQFFKSLYYFSWAEYFVKLFCYVSCWSFNWAHPNNYLSFLLCVLIKTYQKNFIRKKIMQGCDNPVSGWLMSLRVWAKLFHLNYGIHSARFF